MSEAAMGEAVPVNEATETAGKQFQGKEVKETKEAPKNEPDFSKMTGAEAKAYVEAQKAKAAKKDPVKTAAKDVSKKREKNDISPEPIAETDTPEPVVKKYKVKVDGQELEVDEGELLRGYSHQKAANKILQDGKAARKQAEEFIAMMKDPQTFYETAKKLGHDPRKLAEEYLARQLEDEMMDPRDKELRDVKMKLKEREELDRMEKERIEKHRHEALKAKWAKDYEAQFVDALKNSQLPPTKEMVAEMARYVARSAKIGFKMTAAEAAQLVKEDLEIRVKKILGESDAETLVRILGDGAANKIREYDVKKLKSPEQHLKTPEKQGEIRERKVPDKRMTTKEWREFNRK